MGLPEFTSEKIEYLGLFIDYSRDQLLTEQGLKLVKEYYLQPGETSPQEAYARAAVAWSTFHNETDFELAQRIYEYASNQWFMFASPVLSNAPLPNQKLKGQPISCFLAYIEDSIEGLIEHTAELRWLSIMGGGVGGHWSDVRSISDIAPGPIPFLKTVDSDMTAYRQGKVRRGSYAAYMDISHPDIIEFLNLRIPNGGDINRKCLNINNAINISDDFMNAVYNNLTWNLVDPKDKTVRDTLNARELWQRILEVRFRTGEPYICFIDTCNMYLPQTQKDLGLKINGSNLCSEITLVNNEERTAVCCLSSVNVEKFDEWKESSMIADLMTMLDNVLEYFIENAPDVLHRAKFSAFRERSVGLGMMGWHSYLQKNNIPWESSLAVSRIHVIQKNIKDKADQASLILGALRSEAPDMQGTGERFAHKLSVAPNANSSVICGTSASIEPISACIYTHRTRVGSHQIKNKYLEKILSKLNKNNQEIWSSIIANNGSVQHLDFLDQDTKDVFKTCFEIDQHWIIEHAAHRQKYIDQAQSLNLFFPFGVHKSYVNSVHLDAWKKGLKTLYYLRTETASKAEAVSQKVERIALKDSVEEYECLGCSG